ncbi:2-oxo acid dehydrogenase subunit E2 [Arthrobacter sp. SO3]|uniref:2-oxo acid dehydrogenase subunit E2 n=1 Tax=Arthrobacter sp. SO3 TaxID=1897057 RepID=UPI001CFF64E4|nr:2-oxo acid dehydrogenase subunit E2 [Arthrobacter sp. SO3]
MLLQPARFPAGDNHVTLGIAARFPSTKIGVFGIDAGMPMRNPGDAAILDFDLV